jgi:hypothetical protein
METFVDNVNILAIENCLIHPFETILTPAEIDALPNNLIDEIGQEAPHVQRNREHLESQLEKLKRGREACRRHRVVMSGTLAMASSA